MKARPIIQHDSIVSVAGLTFNPLGDEDIVRLAGSAIESCTRQIIGHHNLHGIYLWYHHPEMRNFYEAADYIHIDGMFLILLGNLVGFPLQRKHRGTSLDFFPLLASQAITRGWRIFYLGSRPGVAEKAADNLRGRFPGLQIRTHHGHFNAEKSGEDNQRVLAEIREYAPHILFVGMGMPRQEIWILENQKQIEANVIFPAGAFMDYMAGEIPTSPRWLAAIYLEWLYRLLSEPARLWRRYLVEPWFVFGQIAKYYLKGGRANIAMQDSRHE
jgi:N-acetylglucosaminyldiphosphoundecaprenol N-acetyl-beta-D-mannosaminyltransferase